MGGNSCDVTPASSPERERKDEKSETPGGTPLIEVFEKLFKQMSKKELKALKKASLECPKNKREAQDKTG